VNNAWSVILDPISEGQICEIRVTQEGQPDLIIEDVLFGDIWVCSGQSNMEWPMSKIFNSEEEIAAMASFDKIRFTFQLIVILLQLAPLYGFF
jgi:sialate O-acetylesterase